jgi:hypothetical protein
VTQLSPATPISAAFSILCLPHVALRARYGRAHPLLSSSRQGSVRSTARDGDFSFDHAALGFREKYAIALTLVLALVGLTNQGVLPCLPLLPNVSEIPPPAWRSR